MNGGDEQPDAIGDLEPVAPAPSWPPVDTDRAEALPATEPTAALPPEQTNGSGPVGTGPREPSRWLRIAAIALVAGVLGFAATAVVLSATDNSSGGNRASSGTTPPQTPTTPPQPNEPDAAVLGRMNVQQSDVPPDDAVVLRKNGSDAVGTATLDLCNGRYPSEKLRTARRQVAVADSAGNGVLRTVAVLYKNPAAAAQAFTELQSVVAHCPKQPVTSPVGEPTVTTVFGAAPDRTWPAPPAGVQRQAYDLTTTDISGQSTRSTAVYLRKGRALLGIYFMTSGDPGVTVNGKNTIPDIVKVFEARVAALPDAVTNHS